MTDQIENLKTLARSAANQKIMDLFAENPNRVQQFSHTVAGLHVATDKQRWGDTHLRALYDWAQSRNVLTWRDQLFAGTPVNITEGRAASHMALRTPDLKGSKRATAVRDNMKTLVEAAHSGVLLGKPVEAIVNIGVGGSGLGPKLVIRALNDDNSVPTTFAANVDGAELTEALADLDPATTLVVVVSKTFTTLETMMNANVVKRWLIDQLGDGAVSRHCIAASAAPERAEAWGIDPKHVFPFWDWVGGRFSLWSAAGISIPLAIGWHAFQDMLDGAAEMDAHVADADIEHNLAILLALLDAWNRLLGHTSRAVVPYASRLQYLPGYLQQLEMESNGKSTSTKDQPITDPACPVVWGDVGTTGQHAFFQMLHQGVEKIPVEFVLVANSRDGHDGHHRALLSNGLAQSAALLKGKTAADVRAELEQQKHTEDEIDHLTPHMIFSGDRPSTTIVMDHLSPKRLGALLALYEHKTALLGRLWGINPFDQFGVELGKHMAKTLTPRLEGDDSPTFDPSTEALLQHILNCRETDTHSDQSYDRKTEIQTT